MTAISADPVRTAFDEHQRMPPALKLSAPLPISPARARVLRLLAQRQALSWGALLAAGDGRSLSVLIWQPLEAHALIEVDRRATRGGYVFRITTKGRAALRALEGAP